MPYVLRTMKNSERQPGQEIPRAQVPSHRPQLEARLPLQENVHVLQLRNVVLPVAAVFDQLGPILQILATGMPLVQFVELSKYGSPSINRFSLVN